MRASRATFPSEFRSEVEDNMVEVGRLKAAQFRLDASAFLSSDRFSTYMPNSSSSESLAKMADVFTVYIQSPVLAYVDPFGDSRPYMTTSELAEYQGGKAQHVSLIADRRLLAWEIRRGDIVVSRSGRVGEYYWVAKKLAGALVGDSFRVVPRNAADAPLLYTVLASKYARDFLSGSAYGSVVDHASVDQLRNFPIPRLKEEIRSKISSTMSKALAERESAYDLLDETQSLVLEVNGLPPLDRYKEIGRCSADVETFNITRKDVSHGAIGASEFRLEAHFYNSLARAAIAKVEKGQSHCCTVGNLSHDVILCSRFKRNYVQSTHGTPFLSGRNIVQVRLTDLNYLSNTETEGLQSTLLRRGLVLVTRSGTIGRTCLVWHNFEEYAASEHILRIVPVEEKVDAGYLYAFLASDYGYEQIVRFRYGSVIDEISDEQLKKVVIPLPSKERQRRIGDLVRLAYEKRAAALRLEAEAQDMLMLEIRKCNSKEKKSV